MSLLPPPTASLSHPSSIQTSAYASSEAAHTTTIAANFHGVAALPHLGVIRVTGADAASFLHNQLTHDVLLMQPHQCRLAAFCNAKGRMQASFVLYKRSAEELLLLVQQDLLAQTLKRLAMFVLRAKATLSDASEAYTLRGLAGRAVEEALLAGQDRDPATPLSQEAVQPWQRHSVHTATDSADVLTLYPAWGQARAIWIAPVATPTALGEGTALSTAPHSALSQVLRPEQWQVGEVMSGVAWVQRATFEAFVPQMLNYESVDGVSFKKGCYPGQEVVARSQFRGTLKRRAFLVQSDSPMTARQEVWSDKDSSQPCGLIAQAASDGAQHVALAELQLSATTDNALLRVGATDGPALRLLALPYALRDDI